MRRLVAVAALALALSACELGAEINVNNDGSGTFGFVFGVEDQFLAFAGQAGDPFAEARRDLADDPVQWKVTEFKERGLTGIRATVPFTDIEDMQRIFGILARESGSGAQGFDELVLERDGSGWRIDARASAPDASAFGPALGQGSPFGSEIANVLKIELRVTLPGRPVSSNAARTSERDGRTTFVWVPDLANPAPLAMSARTTAAGGGGLPVYPIAAAVVTLVGIVAAALLLRRRPSPAVPVLEGFVVPSVEAAQPAEAPVLAGAETAEHASADATRGPLG